MPAATISISSRDVLPRSTDASTSVTVGSLIELGTQRFSQLRRLIPAVSQRMLTKQLRDLERAGLVQRVYHQSIPPRVEYSVTELGRSLRAIHLDVCTWAETNWPAVQTAQQQYDKHADQAAAASSS